MSPEEKIELRSLIEQEIVKLTEEIATLEAGSKPISPDNAIGRLIRMEAINAKSISDANMRKAGLRRRRLEDALSRIGEEDFGICEGCERPIPMQRIMIVPESTYCVRCLSR